MTVVRFISRSPNQPFISAKKGNMDINYGRIDAGLSARIGDVSDRTSKEIDLFVATHAIPDADQVAILRQLGVREPERQTTIFTARLSVADIETLSNETWVKRLSASQQLK